MWRNSREGVHVTLWRIGKGYKRFIFKSLCRRWVLHLPKAPREPIEKKGEQYFENWEITGSAHKSKGDNKFPLSEWFRDELYAKLKETSV